MTSPKLHFGALKKDKVFLTIHQTMKRANAAFYDQYDPQFLAKKASLLYSIYKNADEFWKLSEGWTIRLPDQGQLLSLVATELHMASFHQTEAMLSFLLCEFQNRPDWVYLTTYGNADIKNAARAIFKGDLSGITDGAASDIKTFIKLAVFAGWDFSNSDDAAVWEQSVDDLGWLVKYTAERFCAAHEYNSYKHGLRVALGPAGLAASMTPQADSFKQILSIQHAVTHLELAEEAEGYVGSRVTKEIGAEYSFELIHCMSTVLVLAKALRIARISGQIDELQLPQIDREGIMRIAPTSSFSFSY
jgi:hypothetical protein